VPAWGTQKGTHWEPGSATVASCAATARASKQLDALRQRLPQSYSTLLFQQRQLREIRGVLNDLHKMNGRGRFAAMPQAEPFLNRSCHSEKSLTGPLNVRPPSNAAKHQARGTRRTYLAAPRSRKR
jgi:hypothetical protein